MHACKVGARNARLTRRLGAAAVKNGVVIGEQLLDLDVDADIDAAMEGDALALHLLDAAVDEVLLHLEIGNAVAQQAARLGLALIKMHLMVSAAELLGSRHA